MTVSRFEEDGFAIVEGVLSDQDCFDAAARVTLEAGAGATRCLLAQPWCRDLGERLRTHPDLSPHVPGGHVAVQCTFFQKSAARNWLVPIHQDLSIPVASRVEHPSLHGWSHKEGMLFVQPPESVLRQMVALRVHLDPCNGEDGPLRVVPGSHTYGVLGADKVQALRGAAGETVCVAPAGAVLALRPLLLHASSKGSGSGARRVLHFVFGPAVLPLGLAWSAQTLFSAELVSRC